ncbi:hypothetical protein [Candidatus Anaplasma sp. TIGMIC]|uniref:hypothetical protein n=1 Tax=Candidatus Anaplasma sp. TIGMIC TaxID=3020713 RepID=UPI00232BA749|nr:hypothetical protein [Candidatus Anaplasma sp. TIGMIC]MDB1135402.1 hypothetical protein [Candidatus Anaplasma sp. TIGMIC]
MSGTRLQNLRDFVVDSGIRPQVVSYFSRRDILLLRGAVLRYAMDARHREAYRSWVLDIVLQGSENALIRAVRHFTEEEMQFMAQNNPPLQVGPRYLQYMKGRLCAWFKILTLQLHLQLQDVMCCYRCRKLCMLRYACGERPMVL